MDRIRIVGGNKLRGTIPISGAKNAALPLMIASLLTRERLTLKNLPRLADVNLLVRILGNHGVDYAVDGKRNGGSPDAQTVHLTAGDIVVIKPGVWHTSDGGMDVLILGVPAGEQTDVWFE